MMKWLAEVKPMCHMPNDLEHKAPTTQRSRSDRLVMWVSGSAGMVEGRYNGCYNGQIVEEAIEAPAGFTRTAAEASDDPTRPDREASIQLSAVASMTSADTQNTGATGVAPETALLQVKLDGAEEPVEIASYLVMSVIDKSSM
ncbi:unnamed protein product [Symbiodinium necroappetens]|uniref:Uncharacterized protein n=1 Tax=Symbiodinium necroappetens TaxID=1628268 RepID=A0A812JUX2_9DINO|nr:unnamed protein product [Symbiodinium necroappetens]